MSKAAPPRQRDRRLLRRNAGGAGRPRCSWQGCRREGIENPRLRAPFCGHLHPRPPNILPAGQGGGRRGTMHTYVVRTFALGTPFGGSGNAKLTPAPSQPATPPTDCVRNRSVGVLGTPL